MFEITEKEILAYEGEIQKAEVELGLHREEYHRNGSCMYGSTRRNPCIENEPTRLRREMMDALGIDFSEEACEKAFKEIPVVARVADMCDHPITSDGRIIGFYSYQPAGKGFYGNYPESWVTTTGYNSARLGDEEVDYETCACGEVLELAEVMTIDFQTGNYFPDGREILKDTQEYTFACPDCDCDCDTETTRFTTEKVTAQDENSIWARLPGFRQVRVYKK